MLTPFDRAKLQRYRIATAIGSGAWLAVIALGVYLAVTVINQIPVINIHH